MLWLNNNKTKIKYSIDNYSSSSYDELNALPSLMTYDKLITIETKNLNLLNIILDGAYGKLDENKFLEETLKIIPKIEKQDIPYNESPNFLDSLERLRYQVSKCEAN